MFPQHVEIKISYDDEQLKCHQEETLKMVKIFSPSLYVHLCYHHF